MDSITDEKWEPEGKGSVYLLQSGNGYYKIGVAKNVEGRLGGIRAQFPISIDLVHAIKSRKYHEVENFLHRKFLEKRVEREWFKLEPKDVYWFLSLRDYSLDKESTRSIPGLPRKRLK